MLECLRLTTLTNRICAVVIALASTCGSPVLCQDSGTASVESPLPIKVSPSSGVRGKKYDLTLAVFDKNACDGLTKSLRKTKGTLSLVAPEGSDIDVTKTNVNLSSPCVVIASVSISADAPVDTVLLRLEEKQAENEQ